MQEMVLGVRSSAWNKGIPLGEQFKRIATHRFKYVNVIFDTALSAEEKREAVKIFKDLDLYSGQVGVNVSTYNAAAGPASWTNWIDTGKRKIEMQIELGGTEQHGGLVGEGTADISGWIRTLKPLAEETAADIDEVPAAVIEFGASDPDAEAARIIEYLKGAIPEIKMAW